MTDEAEKIAAIATLSSGEVLGWYRWVTGFYHNSRNWFPGERAALINRAEILKIKIEGLNA